MQLYIMKMKLKKKMPISINDQVAHPNLMWPTPTQDSATERTKKYKQGGTPLTLAAKMWPTPNASDNRDRGNLSDPAIQRRIKLGKQVGLTMAVKENKGGGALNPTWVEWLMGYKAGYTDLKDWEMLSSRKLRKKSGKPS